MNKLLMIIILCLFGYIVYDNLNTELTGSIQELKTTVQEEVMSYKEPKTEIKKSLNPEIVNKKLSDTGKIIVYEGVQKYKDTIIEETLFTSKRIDVELQYKYGIGMDLSKITIGEWYGDTYMGELIYLRVPRKELKLLYVELDTKNSVVKSTKSFLAKQYKPEDIKVLMNNANIQVKNKIVSDKQIFIDSMDSLKKNVKDLVEKLGYSKVRFEEI